MRYITTSLIPDAPPLDVEKLTIPDITPFVDSAEDTIRKLKRIHQNKAAVEAQAVLDNILACYNIAATLRQAILMLPERNNQP